MFTGLIEEIGKVRQINHGRISAEISISAQIITEEMNIGDSVCVNGACLTVTHCSNREFTVDVMPQTMRLTNLHELKPGDGVNLERALTLNDRLGGHLVSGHIDGTGLIQELKKEDNAIWVSIHADPITMYYIIDKGSVTIDGISLTVAKRTDLNFSISIIPHTGTVTTLLNKKAGDKVNIESDMVGKYIEHFVHNKKPVKSNIDYKFLQENGFLES
jgi:riboflavin synthase